jgi:hypothetical protein
VSLRGNLIGLDVQDNVILRKYYGGTKKKSFRGLKGYPPQILSPSKKYPNRGEYKPPPPSLSTLPHPNTL